MHGHVCPCNEQLPGKMVPRLLYNSCFCPQGRSLRCLSHLIASPTTAASPCGLSIAMKLYVSPPHLIVSSAFIPHTRALPGPSPCVAHRFDVRRALWPIYSTSAVPLDRLLRPALHPCPIGAQQGQGGRKVHIMTLAVVLTIALSAFIRFNHNQVQGRQILSHFRSFTVKRRRIMCAPAVNRSMNNHWARSPKKYPERQATQTSCTVSGRDRR